jgi:UDP-N-acetylmuramyl pentapeptide phosphotransferase/UDP-N-acetylglucosamine-1-phosphate transferase
MEVLYMETEVLGIILGAVLPVYPLLFVIYQRIGRYDEIVEEFKRLRTEHERYKEVHHGS